MTKEEAINRAIELEFGIGNAQSIRAHNSALVKVAEHLYELMQPSLPSNLDEAAENLAKYAASSPYTKEDFKAGARWMAEQGQIKEGVVIDNAEFIKLSDDTYLDLDPAQTNNLAFKFSDGDKVIVQIRKVN